MNKESRKQPYEAPDLTVWEVESMALFQAAFSPETEVNPWEDDTEEELEI